MQLLTPTNAIDRSLSNILSKGLNIYDDLKIGGSADKKNIIRLKIADKIYYICGRNVIPPTNVIIVTFVGEVANHRAHICNNPIFIKIHERSLII